MKKTLLSLALAAVSVAASAQTFNSIPWEVSPYLAGITISNNGKYIGGCDYTGIMFVADWATQSVMTQDPPKDTDTGLIRAISDDGVGVGFNGDAAVSLDMKGNYKVIYDGDGIATSITPDGKKICGVINTNTVPAACYWQDDQLIMLPEATDKWLGIKSYGTSAEYISDDGSVIAGHLIDKLSTRPLIIWHLNKDGKTYSIDPTFKRFAKVKTSDGNGLMCYFTPTNMSGNGKWIALTVSTDNGIMTMGRYNVDTDELEVINCQDAVDADFMCEASGISNDGTILGYYGDSEQGIRYGVICKPGETEAVKLSAAFSGIQELAHYDELKNNTPTDITPDGKYILGHSIDIIDYYGEEAMVFITYIIDVDGNSASVKSISRPVDKVVNGKEVYYTIDGKRINPSAYKGLIIKKDANGNIKKFMK